MTIGLIQLNGEIFLNMKINDVSEEERIKHNLMRMESEESPKIKKCVAFSLSIVSISLFCVQSFKPFFIFFF